MTKQQDSCEDVRLLLADLAVGDAPPEHVSAHLATCPDCRAELENLQQALAALSSRSSFQPADDFHSRLRARVIDEVTRPQRRIGHLAPAMAVAALLLMVFFYRPADHHQMALVEQLELEAMSSLMTLDEIMGVLPAPSTEELLAELSNAQLDRLAEKLEDLMG